AAPNQKLAFSRRPSGSPAETNFPSAWSASGPACMASALSAASPRRSLASSSSLPSCAGGKPLETNTVKSPTLSAELTPFSQKTRRPPASNSQSSEKTRIFLARFPSTRNSTRICCPDSRLTCCGVEPLSAFARETDELLCSSSQHLPHHSPEESCPSEEQHMRCSPGTIGTAYPIQAGVACSATTAWNSCSRPWTSARVVTCAFARRG